MSDDLIDRPALIAALVTEQDLLADLDDRRDGIDLAIGVVERAERREGLTLAERLAEATIWPAETWQQIIDAAQRGADPLAGYCPRHIVTDPDPER